METKANYVAVGAFVLGIIVVLFVAVLWVARVQFQEEFTRYDTFVQGPITGLGVGSVVRLNGIDVGRVSDIAFDPDNSNQVQVTLKIKSGTPIKADSVASMETQGLTGVSYVEISGGSQSAPLLTPREGHHYAIIKWRPSSLQQVFNSAPDLLAHLVVIADRLSALLDEKNRQSITDLLANLDQITGAAANRGADIEAILANGAKATADLDRMLGDLRGVIAKANGVGDHADQVLESTNETVHKLDQLSTSLNAFVTENRPPLRDFTTVGMPQLTQLVSEMRTLVSSLTKVSIALERDPQRFLFGDRREGFNPR